MIKKIILIIIPLLLLGAVGVFAYNYLHSVDVKLTIPNSSSIIVKNGDHTIAKTNNNQTIHFRAPRFSLLNVSFTGVGIYGSSSRTVAVKDTSIEQTIQPYYSENELKRRAGDDTTPIEDAIFLYNPAIKNLYTVNDVTLYHFADWASAKLVWRGAYGENSDTLHVVLKKADNKWTVVNQPDILLFRDYYEEVPIDILTAVNNN